MCVVFLFLLLVFSFRNWTQIAMVMYNLNFNFAVCFSCRYCFIFWLKISFHFIDYLQIKLVSFCCCCCFLLLFLIETIVNLIKSLMSRYPRCISIIRHTNSIQLIHDRKVSKKKTECENCSFYFKTIQWRLHTCHISTWNYQHIISLIKLLYHRHSITKHKSNKKNSRALIQSICGN